MKMKQIYLAIALVASLGLQGTAATPRQYAGVVNPATSAKVMRDGTHKAPQKVTVDDLFACPENTVLDGPYINDEVGFSGFQSSDQGRPGMSTNFFQAFHGNTKSVNAVRVIGLFNYFDEESYNWLACDSRGDIQEDYSMAKPVTFEVGFYREDANGEPGECIYKNNFDIKGRYIGVMYGEDSPLYEFVAELGEEIRLESGFMSFSAADLGDSPTCWFSLFTADTSMDYAYIDLGPYGRQYANMPCIFSFMGTGEMAAKKALRVDSFSSPVATANGTHEKVSVKLINVGADEIKDAALELWLDGQLIATENVSMAIPSEGSYSYTFLNRLDLSEPGRHVVEVRNATPGDEKISRLLISRTTYTNAEGEVVESAAEYEDEELGITHVKIGTIDNASGPSLYTDYTDSQITELRPGEVLTLEVTPNDQNYVGVWIDWNCDGYFNGEGEEIGYIYKNSLEVRIPEGLSVTPGLKRMRLVFNAYGDVPAPSGTYYYGETEDYGIMVTRAENSAAAAVNLSEIAATLTNSESLTVPFELINEGNEALTAAMSVEYGLPTIATPRDMAPAREFTSRPKAAARAIAKAAEPVVDETVKQVLRYDGGFESSVALGNYDKAVFAHYYPADVMQAIKGMQLSSLDIYFNQVPVKATVKVYGQGSYGVAGDEIASQEFEPVADSWNRIILSEPVTISGDDLWFGVELQDMAETGYYVGIDGIPAVGGYGDLCNVGGNKWWSMKDLGIDHNFCIRGNVTGEDSAALSWIVLDKGDVEVAAGAKESIGVSVDSRNLETGFYEATVKIASNDALRPVISIPVYLSNGIVTGINATGLKASKAVVENGQVVVISEKEISGVAAYTAAGVRIAAAQGSALNLDGFADGLHIVTVDYTDGERESFKIIVKR